MSDVNTPDTPAPDTGSVPPDQWTPHKPFDSSDYLDGDPPTYAEPDASDQDAAPQTFDPSGDEEVTDG